MTNKTDMTRKEFLKLSSMLPLTSAMPLHRMAPKNSVQSENPQNILIIVFLSLTFLINIKIEHLKKINYHKKTKREINSLSKIVMNIFIFIMISIIIVFIYYLY